MQKTYGDKKEGMKYEAKAALIIVSALLLAFVVSSFFIQLSIVDGDSMSPTLEGGNILFISKRSHFSRGDIIVFRKKDLSHAAIVKRVWGFPGETVNIKSGTLYINGTEVLSDIIGDDYEERRLGNDEFFVLGDNTEHSKDSRSCDVGLVKENEIFGRVFLRLIPFTIFKSN